MGLLRTVFEINGNFSRKSQISPPRVFNAPAIGYRRLGLKTRGYQSRKKFDDIFGYLDTTHERDGQTEGRTDGHRTTAKQQRPRLRITSRGNTMEIKVICEEALIRTDRCTGNQITNIKF